MTNPYATGTRILVHAPTIATGHWLVTNHPLTLLPGEPRRAARTHEDPATGITTQVLVVCDDEASGWLAPNPDRCPLCTGHGHITVREGTLPRNDKGEIELPDEVLIACLRGEQPEPVHDDVIDVRKPCPLCRSIDYAMQMDDEIGCL